MNIITKINNRDEKDKNKIKSVANNLEMLPGLKQALTDLPVTHCIKVKEYEKQVLVDCPKVNICKISQI